MGNKKSRQSHPGISGFQQVTPVAQNVPVTVVPEKYTHAEAFSKIDAAGIGIRSSGGCSDSNKKTCTSLEQVRANTIEGAIALSQNSKCPIIITGGTEVGHGKGTFSHSAGFKLDYSLNKCLNDHITTNYESIGIRPFDKAPQYKDPAGNVFAREKHHWDVRYK